MNSIIRYLTEIACDREYGFGARCLIPFLWIFSCCYKAVVCITRGFYKAGILKSFRAPVPVISVRNITAGGTGKTPFVVTLCRMLKEQGFSPMILTRGYMAGQGGASDEAEMLKELVGSRVFVGANRAAVFKASYVPGQFDCVILDDGFQQWGLKKDLDIVLIDSEVPFGNGSLIPRGVLREPLSALRRADVVVFTKADRVSSNVLAGLKSRINEIAPSVAFAQGAHQVGVIRQAFDSKTLLPKDVSGPAGAFCAIGSPESFKRTLEGLDVDLKFFVSFFDHYRFTMADMQKIAQECRFKGLRKVFITHKDFCKVKGFREAFDGINLIIIDIEFILTYGKTDILSSISRLRRS